MARVNIPSKLVSQIIFDSDRKCCLCDKNGHQIHHLNGKSNNNEVDNLVYLCFNCHDIAEKKGGMSRKLDSETIKKYRELNYEKVRVKRESSLKKFSSPIEGLSTEDLLTISKNALIIIELRKIEDEFFNADPSNQYDILSKLYKYSEFTNFRVAVDIFDFLVSIADQTRASTTKSDVNTSLLSFVMCFFPHPDSETENEKVIELAEQCIQMAFAMSYDSALYLNNLYITMYSLTIYKYIYAKGRQLNIDSLIEKVLESYEELEKTLQRPERTDLIKALWLVREFRKDLDEGGLAFPPLPQELMNVVNSHEREERRTVNPNK